MSSPRSSLYRGLAEQPSGSLPISASPARSTVPGGSTAAARKVAEVFSLAGIEIGGHRMCLSFASAPGSSFSHGRNSLVRGRSNPKIKKGFRGG